MKELCCFSLHTGPSKRSRIKEGLLWWDLSKKHVKVPTTRRVSAMSQALKFNACFLSIMIHLKNTNLVESS